MSESILKLNERTIHHIRSEFIINCYSQVVEELIMNSLDSDSSRIEISIDVQRLSISVSDNGCGIKSFDLQNEIGNRHCTSRIRNLDDLNYATTYGFRGEALSSIASISLLEIQSCADKEQAYKKVVRGDKVLSFSRCKEWNQNAGTGTKVTVRDLFFCSPVRKKTHRPTAQMAKVKDMVQRIALINPGKMIVLRDKSCGKTLIRRAPCKGILQAFTSLFGLEKTNMVKELKWSHEGFSITGVLSIPSASCCHWSREFQFLYLNRRPVRRMEDLSLMINRWFSKCCAIPDLERQDKTRQHKEKGAKHQYGQFPMYVLDIQCCPSRYDILFDPEKTIVEFSDWNTMKCSLTGFLMTYISRFRRPGLGSILTELHSCYIELTKKSSSKLKNSQSLKRHGKSQALKVPEKSQLFASCKEETSSVDVQQSTQTKDKSTTSMNLPEQIRPSNVSTKKSSEIMSDITPKFYSCLNENKKILLAVSPLPKRRKYQNQKKPDFSCTFFTPEATSKISTKSIQNDKINRDDELSVKISKPCSPYKWVDDMMSNHDFSLGNEDLNKQSTFQNDSRTDHPYNTGPWIWQQRQIYEEDCIPKLPEEENERKQLVFFDAKGDLPSKEGSLCEHYDKIFSAKALLDSTENHDKFPKLNAKRVGSKNGAAFCQNFIETELARNIEMNSDNELDAATQNNFHQKLNHSVDQKEYVQPLGEGQPEFSGTLNNKNGCLLQEQYNQWQSDYSDEAVYIQNPENIRQMDFLQPEVKSLREQTKSCKSFQIEISPESFLCAKYDDLLKDEASKTCKKKRKRVIFDLPHQGISSHSPENLSPRISKHYPLENNVLSSSEDRPGKNADAGNTSYYPELQSHDHYAQAPAPSSSDPFTPREYSTKEPEVMEIPKEYDDEGAMMPLDTNGKLHSESLHPSKLPIEFQNQDSQAELKKSLTESSPLHLGQKDETYGHHLDLQSLGRPKEHDDSSDYTLTNKALNKSNFHIPSNCEMPKIDHSQLVIEAEWQKSEPKISKLEHRNFTEENFTSGIDSMRDASCCSNIPESVLKQKEKEVKSKDVDFSLHKYEEKSVSHKLSRKSTSQHKFGSKGYWANYFKKYAVQKKSQPNRNKLNKLNELDKRKNVTDLDYFCNTKKSRQNTLPKQDGAILEEDPEKHHFGQTLLKEENILISSETSNHPDAINTECSASNASTHPKSFELDNNVTMVPQLGNDEPKTLCKENKCSHSDSSCLNRETHTVSLRLDSDQERSLSLVPTVEDDKTDTRKANSSDHSCFSSVGGMETTCCDVNADITNQNLKLPQTDSCQASVVDQNSTRFNVDAEPSISIFHQNENLQQTSSLTDDCKNRKGGRKWPENSTVSWQRSHDMQEKACTGRRRKRFENGSMKVSRWKRFVEGREKRIKDTFTTKFKPRGCEIGKKLGFVDHFGGGTVESEIHRHSSGNNEKEKHKGESGRNSKVQQGDANIDTNQSLIKHTIYETQTDQNDHKDSDEEDTDRDTDLPNLSNENEDLEDSKKRIDVTIEQKRNADKDFEGDNDNNLEEAKKTIAASTEQMRTIDTDFEEDNHHEAEFEEFSSGDEDEGGVKKCAEICHSRRASLLRERFGLENECSAILDLNRNAFTPQTLGAPITLRREDLSSAHVIGQADTKFILCRVGQQLLCLDQHAADERVQLEALEAEVYGMDRSGKYVNIRPSNPVRCRSLTISEADLIARHETLLSSWGFRFNLQQSTNSNRLVVTAVPEVCGVSLTVQDLLDFISRLGAVGTGSGLGDVARPPAIQKILNSKACRGAIMFGDELLLTECQELVRKLSKCSLAFQCAHGRPSVIPLIDLDMLNGMHLHRRKKKSVSFGIRKKLLQLHPSYPELVETIGLKHTDKTVFGEDSIE